MRNTNDRLHLVYDSLLQEYRNLRCEAKAFIKGGDGISHLNPYYIPDKLRRKLRVLYEFLYVRGDDLNIFAEYGTKVIYTGKAALETESHKEGKKYLQEGHVYTVQTVIPHSCSTSVELQEVTGYIFCASAFKAYDNGKKSLKDLLNEYGLELKDDLKKANVLEQTTNPEGKQMVI